MAQKMKDVVLFGKEAVARGTEAASFPLHQPFLGNGLVPTLTNHLGEIISSSTWPDVTTRVPLGVTAALAFTPEWNRDTIRDLITMITKVTAGDRPSVSIEHTRAGVAQMKYLGCVVSSANLEYSRSGSPDGAAILQGSMNFECMKPMAATGVSAGTQAIARRFLLPKGTFTINAVASTKILSYRRSWTIGHSMGPPTSADQALRMWMEDLVLQEEIALTAQFTAVAWDTLLLAGTEFAASVIHATGTATETVTETMGKAQMESHQIGESEGTVIEEITLKPHRDITGSAAATEWTFQAGIGATVLSL